MSEASLPLVEISIYFGLLTFTKNCGGFGAIVLSGRAGPVNLKQVARYFLIMFFSCRCGIVRKRGEVWNATYCRTPVWAVAGESIPASNLREGTRSGSAVLAKTARLKPEIFNLEIDNKAYDINGRMR